MKTSVLRALTCFLVTIAISYKSSAFPDTDTSKTKKILLASADKKRNAIVVRESNVVYPAIFKGHETFSQDYVEKFAVSRRDYLIRTFGRSKKFFPKAISILKKYNVPAEFAVLIALESGFNANALSGAGAKGYWQFMDDVAKEYNLRIAENLPVTTIRKTKSGKKITVTKKPVDDRTNFLKSTIAAARYLKDRSRNLNGDWLLIAASYNCGVGNVWNAMERSGLSNPTFWDIKNRLPAETRAYVMNFIALNVIFKNYENFSRNSLCFKPVIQNLPVASFEED
ncbi:MAG: hypothetical protein JWQ27_1513 [Ferruginibacter sp.]|nr:hypothetical protein [Ferruginibacter sp.]